MALVNLTINGEKVEVEAGSTILAAAKKLNIKIPTLCHMNLHAVNVEHTNASCRVCVVEVEGRRNLAPACATPVMEGMVIKTNSKRVLSARKKVLELFARMQPQVAR